MLGYGACLVGVAVCVRGHSLRDLFPAATLVAIQAIWFLAPTAAMTWNVAGGIEPFDPAHRPYAFMWIAVGHFVQYLWITAYYATSSGEGGSIPRFLVKALLAGTALWTVPALLFAPGALGALPHDLGLGLLTGAVVNLHHFVLDGAIWKLRDGRVARVLLRPVAATPAGETSAPTTALAPAGLRAAGWAAATLVLVAAWLSLYEVSAGNRAAEEGDLRRVGLAAERRGWLGGATPNVHIRVARIHLRRGDVQAALMELEAGRRIYPTAPLWLAFGAAYEKADRPDDALRAYDEALALDARQVTALVRSAKLLDRGGDPSAALDRLERAAEIDPSPLIAALLESQRRRGQEALP